MHLQASAASKWLSKQRIDPNDLRNALLLELLRAREAAAHSGQAVGASGIFRYAAASKALAMLLLCTGSARLQGWETVSAMAHCCQHLLPTFFKKNCYRSSLYCTCQAEKFPAPFLCVVTTL
jgi:hypothetical protein